MSRFLKLCLAPLVTYFLGFAGLTYPAITSFSTHFFCDGGDGLQNVWNLWWVRTALVERGTGFWFTNLLHHPTGVSLIGHTLNWFNGLLAIPLAGFLSDIQAHNAIVVFAFVMTGWSTFLLAHHISRSFLGSLFAGAAVTFSSFHFSHAQGHLQLVSLEWLPFFLWVWIRFLERPLFRRAALASVALLAVVACDYYYSAYAVIAGAVLFPVYVIRSRAAWREAGWRGAGALASFVALSLATTGAVFFMLLKANAADPLADAHPTEEWGLDLGSLVIPGGHWRYGDLTRGFWELLPGNMNETSVYVGWCLIMAAVFSLWVHLRGPRRIPLVWAVIGTGFFAGSLGSAFQLFGERFELPWMPYSFLERLVPGLTLSGVPVRMTVMIQLSLAVLAAAAFDDFVRIALRSRVMRILFAVMFVIEILPAPIPTTRPVVPDFVPVLESLPDGAVFGLDQIDGPLALYEQILFRKPINGGYIARRPKSCVERLDRMTQLFDEGPAGEFFDVSKARYVVRPNGAPLGPMESGLRPVFVGEECTIFVAAGDPIPSVGAAGEPDRRTEGLIVPDRLLMDAAAAPRLASGWFGPEHGEDGRVFRWTGKRAIFSLVPSRPVSRVKIRLLTRPGATPVVLRVNDDQAIVRRLEGATEAVLTFALARLKPAHATLACSIESEPLSPKGPGAPGDERELGLRVAEIWVE